VNLKKRVVITGVGAVSPFGLGAGLLTQNLLDGNVSIKFNEELAAISDISSKVSSRVPQTDFSFIPRNFRRSMTNMSLYAYSAVKESLENAKIEKPSKDVSLFLGSTISSMQTWVEFAGKYNEKDFSTIKTSIVFQVMSHSPLANIAQSFDLQGAGLGNCAACATGLLNIGAGYLAIKNGLTKSALCGGTDEYHPIMTACFSIMNGASSQFNDQPQKASRPFDKDRCGIVCGEGCGMLYLESLESAQKRDAKIYGEILGFGTNTETKSIAHPSKESIKNCMNLALKDARLGAESIDFINAHATSTPAGDIEEAQAIGEVFGQNAKVNSLKGHIGHTMAASGALELIAALDMANRGKFAATLNLENADPQCSCVKHITETQNLDVNVFMKNSFALGGTNCSLIVKKYTGDVK
jgi:3-oxoacyl-[acyl-carrier-protein] synthase II